MLQSDDEFNFDLSVKLTASIETGRMVGLRLYGPAWRWEMSRRLADRGQCRKRTAYDPVVWQTVHHLTSIRKELRAHLFGDRTVDVAAALHLHSDLKRRLEIEARILARYPIAHVASLAGLRTSVVEDYRDIFFDVSERLDADQWILARVIEPAVDSSIDGVRSAVQRAAYFGGPHVCEHWLRHLEDLGKDHDLTTAEGRAREQLELNILTEVIRLGGSSRKIDADWQLGGFAIGKPTSGPAVAELLGNQTARLLARLTESWAVTSVPIQPSISTRQNRQRRRA